MQVLIAGSGIACTHAHARHSFGDKQPCMLADKKVCCTVVTDFRELHCLQVCISQVGQEAATVAAHVNSFNDTE